MFTPGRLHPPSKELNNEEVLREVHEVNEDMEWGKAWEERESLFFSSTING